LRDLIYTWSNIAFKIISRGGTIIGDFEGLNMAFRSRPFNHYDFDPEFDPHYGDDPDYPFRDTRPLQWRYPEMAEEYSYRGQSQYERINRAERLQRAPVTAATVSHSTSASRCRYDEKDLESNQPRGPGAMLGMRNGQMRILRIEPEHRIIKFKILKQENFKNPLRLLQLFNVRPILLYEKGDTEGYLMLQKTFYATMEVSNMKTNPMLRRGLGKIKFEAVHGEEAIEIARKFALASNL